MMEQVSYKRTKLVITEFDAEDVITTSTLAPPGQEEYEGGAVG